MFTHNQSQFYMQQITYSRAQIQDVEVLVTSRIDFLVEFLGRPAEQLVHELSNQLRVYFSESIKNESYISYLAKYQNHVVGVGGMVIRQQPGHFKNPSGRVAYIMNMWTVPDFRRKGICTHLLDQLVEHTRAMGITAFELHASKEGEPVYVKNGFKLHTEPTYRKYLI